MNEEVLAKLEFNKILLQIAKYSCTENGREQILSIVPFADSSRLSEGELVSQAKEVLIRESTPPLDNIPALSEELHLSRISGSALPAQKILSILKLAVCSRTMLGFVRQHAELAPGLAPIGTRLISDKVFEHHITRVLDDNGEVRDSASRELQRIRSDIKEKNFQLRKLVGKISRDLADKDLLREDYLTLRDGRLVLPIRAEHKRHIRGFIHSESATGQTVYIEPEETLHLNNEIVTLSFAERREIDRLLRELTRIIGEISPQLFDALIAIGFLDSVFARAQHSIEIMGAFPLLSDSEFRLMDARHPILLAKYGREKTVPLSLELRKNKVVIITGPNAGGKTVVLKTVGLLALMVHSGIHIPASPDSVFRKFDSVYVDIGDQQSIEDDLSTFSSHLSNIQRILEQSDPHSLVLLDELGTGTDPVAGAALGIATLIQLRDRGALVLSTTHHGILKTLAESHEGFENAAMQFDTAHLRPTYFFRLGIPGSSYAFEIASRLGFDNAFLSLAESYVDSDRQSIEKALLMIEKKEQELKEKVKKFEIENARLKGLAAMYQKKIQQLDMDKRAILKEGEQKTQTFLAAANKEFENIIRELRESSAEKHVVKKAKEFIVKTAKVSPSPESAPAELFKPAVGDMVRVKTTNSTGIVKELDHGKKVARITSGTITMLVSYTDLELAGTESAKKPRAQTGGYSGNEIPYRLDIRGRRTDEVRFQIIKFVDEAYSSGAERVEILHGKGEGVLKKIVKEILDEHIGVKNSYFAPLQAGGEGVTIIEFS